MDGPTKKKKKKPGGGLVVGGGGGGGAWWSDDDGVVDQLAWPRLYRTVLFVQGRLRSSGVSRLDHCTSDPTHNVVNGVIIFTGYTIGQ